MKTVFVYPEKLALFRPSGCGCLKNADGTAMVDPFAGCSPERRINRSFYLKFYAMSILKKARLRVFATLVLLGAIGLFFAFKPANASSVKNARSGTVYYYNDASTSFSSMQAASNWGTSQNPAYQCGGTANVACSITVPNGVSLQDHLDSFGSQNDLIQAAGKRQDAN